MGNSADTADRCITGITNWFTLPTDSGGITAVAINITNTSLLQSAYTLMCTIIVLVGWNLLVDLIATFSPGNPSLNRYVSLVAIWNSNGPSDAASMMLEHCRRVLAQRWNKRGSRDLESIIPEDRHGQNLQHNPEVSSGRGPTLDNPVNDTQEQETNGGRQSNTGPAGSGEGSQKTGVRSLWWGGLFLFLSSTMWIGRVTAALFIPVELWMGYKAPVNSSYVAYPDIDILSRNGTRDEFEKFRSVKAPSTLRALGAVEGYDPITWRPTWITKLDPPEGQSAGLWAGLRYAYNITGVNLGLQSDPKLTLMVNGSCHTDYTWLVNSTNMTDTYKLWGGKDTFEVKHNEVQKIPPMADFFINDPRTLQTVEWPSNISYAVIVSTAGHYSKTPSQDPWYATGGPLTNKTYPYQVLPKRPVLSCWEAKRWHLNGKEVERTRLEKLPGLKLHRFWIDKVFPQEYYLPRVATLGAMAGLSSLKSSSFGISLFSIDRPYVLDANSSGVLNDLERLVFAGWISDENVLRDTITYDLGGMKNSARRSDGSVDPSVGGFVVWSSSASTISVRVLISVPVTLISLLLLRSLFTTLIRRKGLVTLPSIHELIDKTRTNCDGNHVALGSSVQSPRD